MGKVFVDHITIIAYGFVGFGEVRIEFQGRFVALQRFLERMGTFPLSELNEVAPEFPKA